jgi:hypothetical protein
MEGTRETDSPLEQTGFEPSVPLAEDSAGVPRGNAECRRDRLTVGAEAKRHQSLQIAVPQCIAQGQKRCAQRKR